MITQMLKQMKEERKLTVKQISEASGIPESTISRVLSGQTDNPGFDTVSAIVRAMGGSLDEIIGTKPSKQSEIQPLIQLYEKELHEKNKVIKWLFIACGIMVSVFIFLIFFDMLNGGIGFVRY